MADTELSVLIEIRDLLETIVSVDGKYKNKLPKAQKDKLFPDIQTPK